MQRQGACIESMDIVHCSKLMILTTIRCEDLSKLLTEYGTIFIVLSKHVAEGIGMGYAECYCHYFRLYCTVLVCMCLRIWLDGWMILYML